ncbi:erythromycin esterase-like protein [Rhodococcus sp. 27YEA15]|uniref:erythromycin esterase family protein n=1 Tax=Rhodococcus sp. 27YEA15 TaxID=3156259 RepID=UPI003C7B8D9C
MPATSSLREIGRQFDDQAALGRVVDELIATRSAPPVLFGLGEPTHGIAAFTLLRNDIAEHLITRGYRSVALETDLFAAAVIDDYVTGGAGDIETVLATGFSHGFGAVPGNRELVDRLRTHNGDLAPQDRIHVHGFDAPVEYSGAPSPRHTLIAASDYLPVEARPATSLEIDALLGSDADWSNPAAMFDPAMSVGDSDRARTLRVVADESAEALARAAPTLDSAGYRHALACARTAQGLLRYHAAMASAGPDRIADLLRVRAEMMAENLLAIAERGKSLVFAHNAHLTRTQGSAGALVGRALGERYLFLASDADPHAMTGTFQRLLANATDRRALFPAPELSAALDPSVAAGEPMVRGHIPLTPAEVDGADAVVFLADTDGRQHRYW